MTISRRSFVRLGAAGLLLPAAAGCGVRLGGLSAGNNSAQGSAGSELSSAAPLPAPFTRPLPIPDVLAPVRSDAEGDHYEITQRAAQAELLPGLPTEVWGYNGTFPGPTIVSQRGRPTIVTHRNELPVPVVVHLHGGRTPAEHDGYPTDMILPVGGADHGHQMGGMSATGSRAYVYPMDQPAATLWYHDHRMDFTGPQVYRGLAGFHLVHDDAEDALGLPASDRDIPLMITDRAFAADGSFAYPSVDPSLTGTPGVTAEYMSGVLGDCILVNGAPWPVLEVDAARYRFRLLNASNARRYQLELDPPAPMVQVGSDLGLLAAPVAHERIDIAQAERFDIVIDFSRYAVGDEVTLVNRYGSGGAAYVMRFRVARRAPDGSRIPQRLADVRLLTPSDTMVRRSFVFARGGAEAHGMTLWTVNDQPFDPAFSHADPRLGSVELWRVRALNVEHPFHIHLAQFQVLGKGGQGPGRFDGGWKDTVNLDNGDHADLLVRFDGHRGRYVLHCHNLEHEDMMMMANFDVV
ncbi:multicopper oxidase family protein [Pseudonocardia sp. TRM90224]|uniref:multicopper oxidase family protein n=1 Tax=Pseudonocardia sp. TRM90224 TaxID=2812678 RepID=UPI001E32CC2B|nr:multicopper oxidase domain-containing protein [Pseudonocardia sp. TRM90224]